MRIKFVLTILDLFHHHKCYKQNIKPRYTILHNNNETYPLLCQRVGQTENSHFGGGIVRLAEITWKWREIESFLVN